MQVLDTCQKQEAARCSSTVRFSCSTTDVLSCIMHIINKGYIRRNEDNPHIVEFLVEDPSTPQKSQAHFFSKLDLSKSTGGTKATTRCADDPWPLEHGEGEDTQWLAWCLLCPLGVFFILGLVCHFSVLREERFFPLGSPFRASCFPVCFVCFFQRTSFVSWYTYLFHTFNFLYKYLKRWQRVNNVK